MEEEIYGKESEKDREDSRLFIYLTLTILGIVCLPAFIIGVLFWVIFLRLLRWRPHITLFAFLGIEIVVFSIFSILKPLEYFDISDISSTVPALVLLSTMLGCLLGYIFILYQCGQLKHYPEMKYLKGWAYGFEYARTPYEIYTFNKIKKGCSEGKYFNKTHSPMGVFIGKAPLGPDKEYTKPHLVYRGYDEAKKTTLITGNPGSGKTITMLNLIKNDVKTGLPIIMIDFKKGPDLAYFLSKWAKENGRKFYHFVSGQSGTYKNPFVLNQASYDPLGTGNATSKTDMVLDLREWDTSSSVYKGRAKTIVSAIFYMLETVNKEDVKEIPWESGGIAQLMAGLREGNIDLLVSTLQRQKELRLPSKTNPWTVPEERRLSELLEILNSLQNQKEGLRDQLKEIANILRALVLSSYSDWLAKGETPYHIDLTRILTKECDEAPIVLFQFNPNAEPDFAKYMGNMIVSDIARATSERNTKGIKGLYSIYFDEAQTITAERLNGLVEKVRSTGGALTFSVQSAEQVIASASRDGEVVLANFFNNIVNFIVHNGATLDSATRYSKIVGMMKLPQRRTTGKRESGWFAWNRDNSRHSMVSVDYKDDYLLQPSDIQSLSSPSKANGYISTAYYITKECSYPPLANEGVRIARKFISIPDKEILSPIPEDFVRNILQGSTDTQKKERAFVQPTKNIQVSKGIQVPQKTQSTVKAMNDTKKDLIRAKTDILDKKKSLEERDIELLNEKPLNKVIGREETAFEKMRKKREK